MSAGGMISRQNGTSVSMKTYSLGYTDGVAAKTLVSTVTIEISAQPLTGDELVNAQQGQRNKRFERGYTTTEIQTVNDRGGELANIITYQGVDFEVQRVERWRGGSGGSIGTFYKFILAEANA